MNQLPKWPLSMQTNAAVDLGSNSFHLVIARREYEKIYYLDRFKDRVCLADGLEYSGYLTKAARERALKVLKRYGSLLEGMRPCDVRVVGTHALREARNRDSFLKEAERVLGFPIRVITGEEEARLIYRGVSHHLPPHHCKRLIADIGGGSTELIIGNQAIPDALGAVRMGCINHSRRYFSDGQLSKQAFERAVDAARGAFAPYAEQFTRLGFKEVFGSSGTIKRIENVLVHIGLWQDGITHQSLLELKDKVMDLKHMDHLILPGLDPDHAGVFPGGLALLLGLQEAFGIHRLKVSPYGLREGLVYELLLRENDDSISQAS